MKWLVFGLMSLLILALPSSVHANFDGIVYNTPYEYSKDQLDIDSQILSSITDTVKLYDNQYMEQTVIEFSQKDIDVYIGINILDDKYQNRLDKYIGIAKDYPNVLGIILESDPISHMSESQIIEIVDHIQKNGILASVASTPENWNKMENVLSSVDFVYYYMFDYWNGFSASQSLTKLNLFHETNLKQYDKQSVYEIGYPGKGDQLGTANPSPTEQRFFLDGLSKFQGNYVLFSFADEKQKSFKFGFPGNAAEQHFGLFENGKIKYHLTYIAKQKEIPLENQSIPGTPMIEYTPTLIQTKSKLEPMREIMEIEIISEQGSVDVYYDNKQKHFAIVEPLTIFLDLADYDNVKVIGDSVDSISFFSIPGALAQCDLDSPTCVYLDDANDYDYLGYVISASLLVTLVLYIVVKLKLLPNLKFRKITISVEKNNENGYFERILEP